MAKIDTSYASVLIGDKSMNLHQVNGAAKEDILKQLKELSGDHSKNMKLPGPNPVSIERKDFEKLKNMNYVIAEKTDGVRFVMFFCRVFGFKICCIVNRSLDVFLFPFRNIPRVLFQGTVYDGEICVDKSTGKFVFLVFDAVMVSGVAVGQLNLYDRLKAALRSITEFKPDAEDPAELRFKGVVPLNAPMLIKQHLKQVSSIYETDGVILTPVDETVIYGRHMNMFKLKPTGKHTVDFIVLNSNGELGVFNPKTRSNVRVGQLSHGKIPDFGTVVECSYVTGDAWRLVTIRSDKKYANDVLTFEKTLLNIRENISVDEVINLFTPADDKKAWCDLE